MKSLTQLCIAVLQGATKDDRYDGYLVQESAIQDLETEFMNRDGKFRWTYSWPMGGWNTIHAKTEDEAKKEAKKEWSYPNGEGLHSFRIIGNREYDRIIKMTSQN